MNPRTTGIAFLVAACLAAFLYFYQVKGAPQRKEAEEAAKRLFPQVEEAAFDWVAFTTSDGHGVRAERRDGR